MRLTIVTVTGARIIPCAGGFRGKEQVERAVTWLLDLGWPRADVKVVRLPRRVKLERANWQDIRWALSN